MDELMMIDEEYSLNTSHTTYYYYYYQYLLVLDGTREVIKNAEEKHFQLCSQREMRAAFKSDRE
ncbi:hypothetical protein PGT21_014676 [Puccinia graminis f. sp. tritici]|uniref:Uncharacterized protein n=1 Tax=Puccinia graminis f. sp. tritici TaxID=56615 RepID=A0A5B0NY86_PUCGR|nr:hypothetical protein PGT21_014676 [Puccinia graminis f. sp. tritici]